jgi:hypothetical protein
MGDRVNFYVGLWNARIKEAPAGTLPAGTGRFEEGEEGLQFNKEVPKGRTSGTFVKYEERKAKFGGSIPYYTFDRYQLAKNPDAVVYYQVGRAGGTLPPKTKTDSKPCGALPFVVMLDGEFRVGPSGVATARLNHAHIADMAPSVLYAGTLFFGNLSSAGKFEGWNNDSGAYRCDPDKKELAGLPLNKWRNPGE